MFVCLQAVFPAPTLQLYLLLCLGTSRHVSSVKLYILRFFLSFVLFCAQSVSMAVRWGTLIQSLSICVGLDDLGSWCIPAMVLPEMLLTPSHLCQHLYFNMSFTSLKTSEQHNQSVLCLQETKWLWFADLALLAETRHLNVKMKFQFVSLAYFPWVNTVSNQWCALYSCEQISYWSTLEKTWQRSWLLYSLFLF